MNSQIFNISKNNGMYDNARVRTYKPIIARTLEPLHTFENKYIKKKDLNYCIGKLYELTSNSVSEEDELWIQRLLHQFIRGIETNGFKVKYLPAIMQILEFLATKANDTPEYQEHLKIMLDHCIYPPLLEKSSDHLSCFDILVQYFNVLGYLLVLVSHDEEIFKILHAIRELLVRPTPVEISAVKLEFIHKAVEKSQLPLILTDLIQIFPLNILKNLLDTTFIIVSISNLCCHRMLDAEIFNHILVRFADLTSNNELNDDLLRTPINDIILVLTNILWVLIKSILPPIKFPPNLRNMSAPDNNIMRSLRNVFQSAILNSGRSKKILIIRNDLAAIILGGIVTLPSWHLVNCGIAEDIIAAAATAIESEETQIPNDDDLIFKKILFSILCYFSDSGGLISIMKEDGIIEKMLNSLNYPNVEGKMLNKIGHFSYLMSYKLQTLAILGSKMDDEFVKYNGATKLLGIFNWCVSIDPINTHDTMVIVKTICTIVTSKSSILLIHFYEAGAIPIIYKFLEYTTLFNQFFMHNQRILTFLIITIEYIMMSDLKLIEIHEDQTINILIKIMQRFSDKQNDFPIDERLLITIGSYIGECIVWYPKITKKFVISNGIYIMLDIIENANSFVKNVYLKSLVDMCVNPQCIPYICTWRDSSKKKGFMSLLAKSWREEEIKCNVKRTPDGCIEDVELPVMGPTQWRGNFHSKIDHDFSPTIASMIGSIRPKIYAIRKILLSNSELCEQSKNHYKILLDDLPVEDAITFCIIDQFFRFAQGQVWLEVLNYLEQVGVNPLGTDGQLLLVMSQRHRGCALYVQERQEKILKDVKKKELIEEHEEFIRIRDATLISELTLKNQVAYIRRTTDETYRLRKKKEQIKQINKTLHFPNNTDAQHYQRTFNENWKITPILNHYHSIRNFLPNNEQK